MTKQLVIITGGTSGIGFQLSKELSKNFDLALIYRSNHKKAHDALNLLRKNTTNTVEVFAAEIIDDESAKNAYEQIKKVFNQVPYALINCAGDTKMDLFLHSTSNDFLKMYQSHVFGVMSLTRIACEEMYTQKKGRIINFSSIASFGLKPGMTIYGSAKAAIEGFTRALSKEVLHRNIYINCLQPGIVDLPGEDLKQYASEIKISPMKLVKEVVELLSEDCKKTGEIILLSS